MADGQGDPPVGDILVEGGKIVEIAPNIEAADVEVIDAAHMIVMPGFVDTHRHTWQTCVKYQFADTTPDKYFGGFLPERGPRYRPEDVYIANLLGALNGIDGGVTTLLDWSQIQNTPDHTDQAIQGLMDSGIRAIFGHSIPTIDWASWAIDSQRIHPSDIRRVRETTLSSDDSLVTLAMAGRGPEMAADGTWQADLALARELGIRSSIHMGAFPFNGEKGAISKMHSEGLLGDDLTFIHCCCCHDDEFKMMADHGVTASLGVNVEQNCIGIGDLPFDRLLAVGIEPSLSGDSEPLGASDMFTQMRQAVAYYRSWIGGGHSRVKDAPGFLSSRDALRFATLRGAEANGLAHKIGTLEVGKAADIILIRMTDINLVPTSDPVAAVVYGAHPANVDTVMVQGRVLKRHGKLLGHDLQKLRELAYASQKYVLGDD